MENAKPSQENEAGNLVCAVLVLTAPPDATPPGDWYKRTLVGVPFLLRNLLNLQKGGVQRIVIYHPEDFSSDGDPLRSLAGDSRIQCPVDWITGDEALAAILQDGSCRLVVNGTVVHDQADVAAILSGTLDPERGQAIGHQTVSRESARQRIEAFDPSVEIAEVSPGEPHSGIDVFSGGPETRVRRETDFKVQRERLLTQGGMASDSFMDRWVSRFFSRQFTRLLIDTQVTPNQITWVHMILGFGSAGFFYLGTYSMVVVGAVLLMVSAWLDATDGEVARLRFQQSRFGMLLDIIGDNVVHWAVFLGIGWGVAGMTDNVIYKYCGVLSVIGAMASFGLLEASVFKKRSGEEYESSGWEDELANRDFLYFLFVMALLNLLNIFIMITAVGSIGFAGYILYKKNTSSRAGSRNILKR